MTFSQKYEEILLQIESNMKEMKEKYPELLERCWEIGVGPGWKSLVDGLLSLMQQEQEKSGVKFKVLQIKEKFGMLRAYYDATELKTPQMEESMRLVSKAVHDAENKSQWICEECGKPGVLKSKNGWWSTRCEECRKKE